MPTFYGDQTIAAISIAEFALSIFCEEPVNVIEVKDASMPSI